ncbi:MAG: hypothetical protein JXA21_27615 [Anaerolineae bacterium]|nr:hypothetical protein [Anaerolineae bacterium]
MSDKKQKIPWFLWPFAAIWWLISFILQLTGRAVAAVLGLVFMVVGALLTVTIIGAIVGIPLIIFGFLLMIRSIF